MSCNSTNLNIQSVAGISGLVTTILRYADPYAALLSTQVSMPAALANMLSDISNGQPSNVALNNDGTVSINSSVITMTARTEQLLMLAGLVVGAPVSGSVALAMGVMAVALSPAVQQRIHGRGVSRGVNSRGVRSSLIA